MSMFCYQCEQTAKGQGCDRIGVCGKDPEVAALQDILVHQTKGIGYLAHALRGAGQTDRKADRFVVEALFTTVTNVNFDAGRLEDWVRRAAGLRDELLARYRALPGAAAELPAAVTFAPANTRDGLLAQALGVGILAGTTDIDRRSARELLSYGLKGMAAYADHASLLGEEDEAVCAFFHEALAALAADTLDLAGLLGLCLRCGEVNVRAMELLDLGHTKRFGHPTPATVSTGKRKGPAIVVTGHDLLDLEALLEQTAGKGISVYTHGEMLPAHGYPGLKKYPHLVGHFGTAWQNQRKEFDGVPAAFLFTTNCIQEPKPSYSDRVFTTGLVAWPGELHVPNREFGPVIAKALELGGFAADEPGGTLTTGFARNAVLGVAGPVIEAVKSGAIKRFFLVGGCDGAKAGRNYYTDFVQQLPKDTVVLTLACGKFRFNHLHGELGDIGGIPRLLDIGQCNDAYSALKIAEALAGAFNCGVNDLPLSLVLSWYEQKAVVILLSLLAVGVRNIRIGPSLPAFLSPNVLKLIVERWNVAPTTTPAADIAACMAA